MKRSELREIIQEELLKEELNKHSKSFISHLDKAKKQFYLIVSEVQKNKDKYDVKGFMKDAMKFNSASAIILNTVEKLGK